MAMVTMTVYSVSKGLREVNVLKDKLCQSKFFTDMINKDEPLIFTLQYQHMADIYLDYLDGNVTMIKQQFKGLRSEKGYIINLFLFCYFIDDDTMLDILVINLFETWTSNRDLVNDYLKPEMKIRMYKHYPLALVPIQYHTDMSFLQLWMRHNADKKIHVQHVQHDDYYYPFNETLTYYSDIVKDNTCLISIKCWCDRKPNVYNFSPTVEHGPQLYWYKSNAGGDQQLMSYYYRNYGKLIGEEQEYHSNGKLKEIAHYNDDGERTSRYLFDQSGKSVQVPINNECYY
jgi:antitoxin component YwqK of YwqJK toxin-antitoxin module